MQVVTSWNVPGGGCLRFEGPPAERDLLDGLIPYLDPLLPLTLDIAIRSGAPEPSGSAPVIASDLVLLSRPGDPPFLAIHDQRRRWTAHPRVFLKTEPTGRHFTILVAEEDAYHRKLSRWLLVGLLAALGTLRFTHASAVASREGAALILGGHGSGKSTLAAAAVCAGFRLLGEGVTLVSADGRVLPFFMDGEPVLRLAPRTWDRLREATGEEPTADVYPAPAGGVEPKRVLRLADLVATLGGGAPLDQPIALATVWLPAVGGPAEPDLVIEPLTRAAALDAAWPHLEDRRVSALRQFLGTLASHRPTDPEGHLSWRWRKDFPSTAFRITGSFAFQRLADHFAAGALRLRP